MLTQVHPYVQIALGILSNSARVHFLFSIYLLLRLFPQFIMTQSGASLVPTLFSKVQSVYGFLLEEDGLAIHNMMRDTLARIAYVIRHCVHFIRDYAELKNLCTSPHYFTSNVLIEC